MGSIKRVASCEKKIQNIGQSYADNELTCTNAKRLLNFSFSSDSFSSHAIPESLIPLVMYCRLLCGAASLACQGGANAVGFIFRFSFFRAYVK